MFVTYYVTSERVGSAGQGACMGSGSGRGVIGAESGAGGDECGRRVMEAGEMGGLARKGRGKGLAAQARGSGR